MTAPSTSLAVVGALARVEARKILLHPAILLFAVLTVPLMRLAASDLNTNDLTEPATELPAAIVPLGWALIVVANLAALRSRRHHTDEIFDSTPTTAGNRSSGLLLSLGLVGPLAVLMLGASVLFLRINGYTGWPPLAELSFGVFWVMGGGALGVLAARWLPHPLVGAPVVVATFAGAGALSAPWMGRWTWMGFVPRTDVTDLSVRPTAVHAVYLAATVVIAAGLALIGRTPRRTVTLVLGPAVAVALVAAVIQTRPPSAAIADEMAQRLMTEESQRPCEIRSAVRYCGDPLGVNADGWEPTVHAVLSRVPRSAVATTLVVSQRRPMVQSSNDCSDRPLLDQLDPVIARRVDPGRVWPADGAVHPRGFPIDDGCGGSGDGGLVVGAMTGAWAVGLPPSQSAVAPACDAGGQARAVAALWLAVQVSPKAAGELRIMVENSPGPLLGSGWSTPPTWGVAWRTADAVAALALLERPAEEVTATLAALWVRVVVPATSAATARLGNGPLAAPLAGVQSCP